MKTLYTLLFLCLTAIQVSAQQIHCRPRICMIDYFYHDDSAPNNQKTAILTANPDILVTNTPNSYWGRYNGMRGAIPSYYLSAGIKVYSYIAGGYEGALYGNSIDNVDSNLSRVNGIAADGATGVYLDEVTAYPNTSQKSYLSAISDRCRQKGLKVIFNPGVKDFDPWLMAKCDYILTDEGYNGSRAPSSSERPFLNQVIVIADSVQNANDAALISLGARANGFGYSYACKEYITLPLWLTSYLTMITQPPAQPTVTAVGATLHSSGPYGNQWYRAGTGMLVGDTAQSYLATANGTYYSIVTLDGCSSDTSNKMVVTSAGVSTPVARDIRLFPNPATDIVTVTIDKPGTESQVLNIYDVAGKKVLSRTLMQGRTDISLSGFSKGIYLVLVRYGSSSFFRKLVVQ